MVTIDHAIPTVALLKASTMILTALQPQNATSITTNLPMFVTFIQLPHPTTYTINNTITNKITIVNALDNNINNIATTIILLVLMATTTTLLRQTHKKQAKTKLLYAQLQNTRDAQTETTTVTERNQIANKLHNVLAHSLSNATIQLQGARRLLARDGASQESIKTINQTTELVHKKLTNAHQTIKTLHKKKLPNVAQLIKQIHNNLHMDVQLEEHKEPHPLAPKTKLTLYHNVQKTLTNATRYAPNTTMVATLEHGSQRTTLTVVDNKPTKSTVATANGNGHKLEAMHEHTTRANRTLNTGPNSTG